MADWQRQAELVPLVLSLHHWSFLLCGEREGEGGGKGRGEREGGEREEGREGGEIQVVIHCKYSIYIVVHEMYMYMYCTLYAV